MWLMRHSVTVRQRFTSCVAGLALVLGVTLTIAQSPPDSNDQVRKAIDEGNARYIKAFAETDAKGLADVYDANGARLYPNGSIVRGHDAIEADVQRFVDRVGPVIVTLETDVVWVLDDRAYEPGRWTYTYTPPNQEQRTISGTYVNIWQRQADDTWRLFADLSLPEPRD